MQELKRKKSGSPMRENWKGDVLYFTFPSLSELPFVIHGFSSRLGGVSERELASMNLSFSRGDRRENVVENFRRISLAIGFSVEDMVFSDQTHTTHVRRVTKKECGMGFSREKAYRDVDGLVTNEENVILTGFFADCVPLYFVDPVHRAVGLAHSGWRGTVNDIAGETVRMMHACFSTEPSDLVAAIGPSICRSCYEVGEDVIRLVRENYPPSLWPDLFEKNKSGTYQFDLWETCRVNLLRAGLKPEKISVTDLCTCCNPGLLFSHRATGGKRGNLAAFLGIQKGGFLDASGR